MIRVGKSTLARATAAVLRADGRRVEILDGDECRAHLSSELGFSRADRDLNVLRIGHVAGLLAAHGVVVLAAVVSPYELYVLVRDRPRRRATAEPG